MISKQSKATVVSSKAKIQSTGQLSGQKKQRRETSDTEIVIDHTKPVRGTKVKVKAKVKREPNPADMKIKAYVEPKHGKVKARKEEAVPAFTKKAWPEPAIDEDEFTILPKSTKATKGVETTPYPLDTYKPKTKKARTAEGALRKIGRIKEGLISEEDLMGSLPHASSQEQEHLNAYLHMFKKLKTLIKKAEEDCLNTNNPRNYYAVCTLYSAQREVIADIRSVTDMSGQVQHIENNVLQPMTRSLGQNLLDSFYQVRKLIIETSKPGETQFALTKFEEITKEQGKFLQNAYADALTKVNTFMLGGPSEKESVQRIRR